MSWMSANPMADMHVTPHARRLRRSGGMSEAHLFADGRPRISRRFVDHIMRSLETRPGFDSFDYLGMTFTTCLFGHDAIVCLDSKRIGKVAGRKRERVPEAIRCFRCVFRNESRRCVAVVAGGNVPVARLGPRVE